MFKHMDMVTPMMTMDTLMMKIPRGMNRIPMTMCTQSASELLGRFEMVV